MTRLDPRPARGDLTSRECAKILCGVITAAHGTGARMDLLRFLVRLLNSGSASPECAAKEINAALAQERTDNHAAYSQLLVCARLVGGLIGALADQADETAVNDAIDWVVNEDAIWASAQVTP